jgi:hypothetical protein
MSTSNRLTDDERAHVAAEAARRVRATLERHRHASGATQGQ